MRRSELERRSGRGTESGRADAGSNPAKVPVVSPKVLEFGVLDVAIDEAHVDFAGENLTRGNLAGRAGR